MPLITSNFISYTLKRSVSIQVILPGLTSQECSAPNPTHRPRHKYPVLYLLHGYWNDYSVWPRYTAIERYAEERQIAVVTFSGENNFYIDQNQIKKQGPVSGIFEVDYESFIVKELPDFVTNTFPISKKPADTYIAGLSMGGYGSLVNGFGHPEKYRAVGAFSPLPTQKREDYRAGGKTPEYLRKIEPLDLILKAKKRGVMPALYYAYGKKDFLFDMQEWFREQLEENQIACTTEVLPEYGHEWAFWDLEVKRFLDWIPRSDAYYQETKIRPI